MIWRGFDEKGNAVRLVAGEVDQKYSSLIKVELARLQNAPRSLCNGKLHLADSEEEALRLAKADRNSAWYAVAAMFRGANKAMAVSGAPKDRHE